MSATPEAIAAAAVIKAEAAKAINDSEGRPLPLLAVWDCRQHMWSPDYQVQLLQSGYHIIPTMTSPDTNWTTPSLGAPSIVPSFNDYYSGLLTLAAELELPISFIHTQWNTGSSNTGILLDSGVYGTGIDTFPGVIHISNVASGILDPMGPTGAWADPAATFITSETDWVTMQSLYPNPPLVIFISNNEPPELKWRDLEKSKRYVDTYGLGQSDDFKISIAASGWTQRYNIMLDAIQGALTPGWSGVLKFIGYDSFGPQWFGRYAQPAPYSTWQTYSLCPLNMETGITPNWYIWDGSSTSYYQHNWNTITDYNEYSTQIESCNFDFMLEEALAINPNYWHEIVTWDGTNALYTPSTNCSTFSDSTGDTPKPCTYKALGQTVDEDRYEGWLQFGLWLCRPKSMREWRWSLARREWWQTYFDRFLQLIERVHNSSTLTQFWRNGTLVVNPSQNHPYNKLLPPRYVKEDRWFLLDCDVNPSPIQYRSPYRNINVFALAYRLGSAPNRQWLIYAHAPRGDLKDVLITVPGYGNITLNVDSAGTFYTINESFLPLYSLVVGSIYRLEFTFDTDYYLILEHEATRTKVWKCSNSQPYYINHTTPLLSATLVPNLSVAFQPFTEDTLQLMYDVRDNLLHSGAKALTVKSLGRIIAMDERKLSSDKGSTLYLNGRAATDSAIEVAKLRKPD